jgi:hypothetical protein
MSEKDTPASKVCAGYGTKKDPSVAWRAGETLFRLLRKNLK